MKNGTGDKNKIILLAVAIIAAVLYGVYTYVVAPKMAEARAKTSEVENLEAQINELSGKIADSNETNVITPAELVKYRKKVPEDRGIQNILRDIERLELMTGSRIESVNFSDYDVNVSTSELGKPAEEKVDAGQQMEDEANAKMEGKEVDAETDDKEQEEAAVDASDAPEKLEMVTFEINLLTPDFKTMRTFLQEIEKLERVVKIDSVNLSVPGEEVKFADKPDYSVSADIQLTTFYYKE